ncbi:hypothetical protein EC957_005498 [Mortierella hygrophila]|uniref:CID domain-containing protein n=1 Tax=Mortierella hygrophila TaxID=979708 RepID=A0A9P6FEB2_9FUNG|nr:hypothetical protein EC957_005498 [Mortierella hygrophila]
MSANKESGTSKDPPPEVKEFEKELHGLFDHSRTASASKIDRLTKLAFKAARYYKNIVYCLEKFITRCVPEYKLTGLYVLDSICRTSQSAKTKLGSSGGGTFTGSEYVARFEKNIEALFVEFTKVVEDKEKEKVKRVVEIWERSGTFAAKTTESIKKKYFSLLETDISRAAAAAAAEQEATAAAAAEAEPAKEESSVDKAASFITSLAASLAASNSPAASAVSSNTSNPSTPPTNTGPTYTPSVHYPVENTYTASPSTNTPVNPLLSGISDPSSALALQTLLATVSQVKAAAAGVGVPASAPVPVSAMLSAPGHHYLGYPGFPSAAGAAAIAPMLMPDYGATTQGTSSLPPVLQQLQGILSNSNQQQNLGFAPNNNTVVSSSTAPPPSTTTASAGASSVMSAVIDPRTGGGRGGAISSLPSGFLGGVSIGVALGGTPGGTVPRDPRAAPIDPRMQLQQPQQQSMPTDPRANPRMGGAQPLGGTAQSLYQQQAQPLFKGPTPPLHMGSLLDGQGAAMLMRNAGPGDVGAKGGMGGGGNKPGPGAAGGLDGHAMAQLASFMNGIHQKEGGSQPHQQQTGAGTWGDNRGQGGGGGGVNGGQDGYPLPHRGGMEDKGGNNNHRLGPNGSPAGQGHGQGYGVKDDPSISPDHIRVISRTLWVGGSFIPSISEQELEGIFTPIGKIATLMINQAKFNAFIKMTDRTDAERCKAELGGTHVQGDVMKVNWGCGFGPRDCFDYTTGTSVIPLERLTDTDRRWLANSVVGGFGPGEAIRGGVSVMEPNIEPVGRDGREALPRRGGLGGSGGGGGGGGHHAGGIGSGGRGRGRGRGRGGDMDQDDFGVGRGRGRGGIHSLPPPPQATMGSNGPSQQHQHQIQHQIQHQLPPTPQPRVHPLPHRPQVSAAGASTVKRDFGGGGGAPTGGATGGGAAGQSDETRRNKKSRWE